MTALLGFGSVLAAAMLSALPFGGGARHRAMATTILLLGASVYHTYFTAIPKTYALSSLLAVCAYLAMGDCLGKERMAGRGALRMALGGFLLAIAASTRLSLGLMLPASGLYLLARRRKSLAWLWFGVGGAAGLALALLPFLLIAPEEFLFANFFHGGRGRLDIVFAAGSLARLARGYMPLLLLLVLGVFPPWQEDNSGISGTRRELPLFWIAGAAAPFALHLLSPFPYDDYQVPLMGLFAASASVLFWRSLPSARISPARIMAVLLAASLAFAAASPLCESWAVAGKDRFWIVKKTEPDVFALRKEGKLIRDLAGEKGVVLTQDTYLAVEAGCRVPQGFEMGPFGFFAGLPDEEALKYKVLNRNLLEKAIRDGEARVAAASGYAFSMSAPAMERDDGLQRDMTELLLGRYGKVRTVENFGQEHTTLSVYELR